MALPVTPYYKDAASGITIYHGDCREVLPGIPYADLVFTSPPYNKGTRTDGNWVGLVTETCKGSRFRDGYDGVGDGLPADEYRAQQQAVLACCWARLSENGAIFYNHKPRIINGEWQSPLDLNPGLPVRQVIVWDCGAGINLLPNAFCPAHEWIVIFARSGWRLRSKGASALGDVWRVQPERSTLHPAPFPLALPARAIAATSPSLVVDPFAGSGTTLVAAKSAGVPAIGIEISEAYCEIAAKRLAQGVFDLFPAAPAPKVEA